MLEELIKCVSAELVEIYLLLLILDPAYIALSGEKSSIMYII